MNRRIKTLFAFAAVIALSLSLTVAAVAKVPRIGTSTQVSSSVIQPGKKSRTLVVTGILQSNAARCERQRSVLLYEVGPTGDFRGAAIGHGVSQGGTNRGQVTITGVATKQISPSRQFRLEAVGRTVRVKGKKIICKRGVSVSFPGDFS